MTTYSTAEVARMFDVTLRQLQHWHESSVVTPKYCGHNRTYSREECLLVGVIRRVSEGRERTKAWYRSDKLAIVKAARRALKDSRNRYLVFFGNQGIPCQSKADVIRLYAKATTGGVLVDLWEIQEQIARGRKVAA